MFGWKAKKEPEEPTWEKEPAEREEALPTWADGSYGPGVPASRVFGRMRDDELHEAALASAQ